MVTSVGIVGGSFADAAPEFFPAADWASAKPRIVQPSPEDEFPRTVVLEMSEAAPMVVTIAGTADKPVPYGSGHITLGLNYTEGNTCWGYNTEIDFSDGGRREGKLKVLCDRPLHNVYAYYGGSNGVKMDPPKFELYPPAGDANLDGVPVLAPEKLNKSSFFVRDVAAGSGYSRIQDGSSDKGLSLSSSMEKRQGARFFKGHLADVSKRDRAVTLIYAVPIPEGEIVWWDGPRTSRKADSSKRSELAFTWGEMCGRGPHSRWPLGAVTVGDRGIAIGIDPQVPAYYRIAVNPRLRLLYIAYDLGLAVPERDYADIAFTVFGFNAADGFRGAMESYRRLYPEAFASRVKKHGSWSAFEPIHKLKDPDDFHIRFNEYRWDLDFDDQHDILSFRYAEPCTWWMKLKNKSGGLPSYDECLKFAEEQAAKGVPDALAWKTSVFKNRHGRPAGMILDKPWCFGISWSMNASPGIKGEMTEYKFKQGAEEFERHYGGKEFPKGCDGEYIDSSELACTCPADYDRNHFAGMKAPLTFTIDEYRPCVFKGLSVWDYSQDLSRRLRERGRVLFANATPNHWSYLTPQMDAVGIEIGWNDSGKWNPDSPDQLLYWRAVSGDKPYCFLMTNNSGFERWMTEQFMKLSLAYGLIPGFQPNYYFGKEGRHDRDRDLFKKYMPFICRVSEAGWRPVNRLASVAGNGCVIEQFGENLLTVYNHGKESADAVVTLKPGRKETSAKELISGRTLPVAGGKMEFSLAPDDVALIEL